MRIDGPWTACPAAIHVHDVLTAAGFRSLFVGGAVRNTILKMAVGDIDVATDARPEKVVELFRQAGSKLATHGMQFGSVMVVHRGTPIEVTSFRRDIETDGRHARVAWSDQIEDDAARRDLTMNAIYAEWNGELLDPLGGLPDLLARRVRFVGIARDRIAEDYLRMLRFFRFHAHFGNPDQGLDPGGLAAVSELADGIGMVSVERVTYELLKLLAAPAPAAALHAMADTGLLERILPAASAGLLPQLEELEEQFRIKPDPLRRLASLGEPSIASRLRLDRRSARRLQLLIGGQDGEGGAAELGYRHGARDGLDIALLRAAASGCRPGRDLPSVVAAGARQEFPLTASHLPAAFGGPAVGEALRRLERRWIASGFKLTGQDLLALLPAGGGNRERGR